MFLGTDTFALINLDNVCEIWLKDMCIFARLCDGLKVQISNNSTIEDFEKLAEMLNTRRLTNNENN